MDGSFQQADIQLIEQEIQKVKVVNAEGVRVEKVSVGEFEQICD